MWPGFEAKSCESSVYLSRIIYIYLSYHKQHELYSRWYEGLRDCTVPVTGLPFRCVNLKEHCMDWMDSIEISVRSKAQEYFGQRDDG